MNTKIFDQSDPTWMNEITEPTPGRTRSQVREVFPAVVAFALSSLAVGAAESVTPIDVQSTGTSVHQYVRYSSPFAPDVAERAWASAMNVLSELGEDPTDVVLRASKNIERWRSQPFAPGDDEIAVDEDESEG